MTATPWLTREETATRLRISISTVDRLIKSGDLTVRRAGRSVRIAVESVDAQSTQETDAA